MTEDSCCSAPMVLVMPRCADPTKTVRLHQVVDAALGDRPVEKVTLAEEFVPLRGRRILFAVSLGESGVNLEYCRFLKKLRTGGEFLQGCTGVVLVDGNSELYTKSVARELVFAANRAGCAFPGRPLVEGTASLENFNVVAQVLGTSNREAYTRSAVQLVKELEAFAPVRRKEPGILALHASNYATSNTLALWKMVKEHLDGCRIAEINLRNGTVADCAGCSYPTCMHYSEKGSCFYGGPMVEEVYPAIEACDALVMICPNYNDALSANLCAFINRLTALFRKRRFYEKCLFGLVVSGYSGGDIVAGQLISGLNMNKTFRLPDHFAMVETANRPGSIQGIPGIEEKAAAFARRILWWTKEP